MEDKRETAPQPSKLKLVTYWVITVLLAFELIDGALWDFNLLNKGAVHDVLSRLGYPPYLAFILGIAKMLAAITILIPGFKLLKEWAYAGLFFLFAGAAVSHITVQDYSSVIFPLAFVLFVLLSWWLRPPKRKIV